MQARRTAARHNRGRTGGGGGSRRRQTGGCGRTCDGGGAGWGQTSRLRGWLVSPQSHGRWPKQVRRERTSPLQRGGSGCQSTRVGHARRSQPAPRWSWGGKGSTGSGGWRKAGHGSGSGAPAQPAAAAGNRLGGR